MATLTHAQSRRLYSWWWDSHISPKNSKWLQENLSDMDMKVKAIIKLIEEDADSFARRAEMYYKKRPELMKLVEEFYRAYRALAERYDHATGALRQAHRTMAEAFPNQIPFMLPDESPSGSSGIEMEPPETPRSTRMLFVLEDGIRRNGAYSEENNALTNKQEFKENHQKNNSGGKGGSCDQIRCLQEEVSRLLKDNQNLNDQATSESIRADRTEAEVQTLKDALSKLESEKEADLRQYQTTIERISNLETEFSCMYLELKNRNDDIRMGLEEQICRLMEENGSLNEQNLSSSLSIENLQGALGLHEEEKKILHQNLSCLQENKIDLEEKHHGLRKQIETVSSNVESLQALAKELQEENVELKKLGKKHEDEKVLYLQNMETISEKNASLENSLSDAKIEFEVSREKIKTLEGLCESLHGKICAHISKKAVLVSQIEPIIQNMEKLSDKNTFLENSLTDVNIDIVGLRQKLKGLEDSYQFLSEQKSNLLAEKNALVWQVERNNRSLENMEKRYAELEDKHSNLEKEKDLNLLQVVELQRFLKSEKHEHETLINSSSSKLLNLGNQIHVLQEEGRLREEDLVMEQHKTMSAHIENCIFQNCICDMKEKNLILAIECQKLLEKSRCAEELISKIEQGDSLLKEKITALSKQNEKLREGVHLILEALTVCKDWGSSDDSKDESLLHLILCEIRVILNNISEAHDENQILFLEKSIIVTLLKQFGLEMADLKLEKDFLEQESKTVMEELVVLQTKKHEILDMNEQLKLDLYSKNRKEELLKSEKEILCRKLSGLQEAYTVQLEENDFLSKKLYDMQVKKDALEQENTVILAEAMNLEHLYLIFKSYSAERASDSKSLADDLDSLHKIRNGLDDRVVQMNEKLGALEIENMHLKDLNINLEDDIKKTGIQVAMKNELLMQKDLELSQADKTLQLLEAKNTKLLEEIKDLKCREEHLTFELKKGANEFQKSELEFATILDDIQMAIVQATIFEEKVLELLEASESLKSSSLVQREVLKDEIASINSYVDELKNILSDIGAGNSRPKAELDAYLPLISSLWKSIASLEEDTLSLAKHHASRKQEDRVDYNCCEPSEDHNVTEQSGVLELQKLHAKVEALQKVVAGTGSLLEKERFELNANLAAAKEEIEALKSERRPSQEKPDTSDHTHEEDGAGISQVKSDLISKDILLDHVSSTSEGIANDNQIVELREITRGHDSQNHHVGEAEAGRSNHLSSEIVAGKQEVSNKVTKPDQELNKTILETLVSDAERLSLLQTGLEELKRKTGLSGIRNHPPNFEFETVKTQMKQTEAAIYELVEFNNKLKMRAEDFSTSTESLAGEFNEKGNASTSRRQISDCARRVSEKIGRLELELQKIEYVLLKLEEEHKYNKERARERRRGVLLRDYLFGRRGSQRSEKKALFCACIRPSTRSD